jgi:hypothetical protein
LNRWQSRMGELRTEKKKKKKKKKKRILIYCIAKIKKKIIEQMAQHL